MWKTQNALELSQFQICALDCYWNSNSDKAVLSQYCFWLSPVSYEQAGFVFCIYEINFLNHDYMTLLISNLILPNIPRSFSILRKLLNALLLFQIYIHHMWHQLSRFYIQVFDKTLWRNSIQYISYSGHIISYRSHTFSIKWFSTSNIL